MDLHRTNSIAVNICRKMYNSFISLVLALHLKNKDDELVYLYCPFQFCKSANSIPSLVYHNLNLAITIFLFSENWLASCYSSKLIIKCIFKIESKLFRFIFNRVSIIQVHSLPLSGTIIRSKKSALWSSMGQTV